MQIQSENIDVRLKMIEHWKQSGKSIMAYCKAENIPYHTFLYWRNKFSKKERKFIKLKTSVYVPSRDKSCEIIFINGNKVNFSVQPNAAYLKELLV